MPQQIALPDKEAIIRCKEVVTTTEAADYLVEQFEKTLKKSGKLELVKPALENVKDYAQAIKWQREETADIWAGKPPIESDFIALQRNKASQSAKDLASFKSIRMNYALSDNSEIIRGYAIQGSPSDEETTRKTDQLFSAWLSQNQLASHEGILYEGNAQGQVVRDEKGQLVRANPEKVNALIADKKNGFSQYVKELSSNNPLALEIKQYPYQAPAPQIKQPAVAETPSVQPEAPEISTQSPS